MRKTSWSWGVASMPLAGQSESGDGCVVRCSEKGVLVAVVDALGHGHLAARAAQVAISILEQFADETPEFLLRRCDELMHDTRGAAMSVAKFDRRRCIMTWLGVGNVTGVLVHAEAGAQPRAKQLMVYGGVVGFQLPPLHPSVMPVGPRDTLVLATDGVRSDFTESLPAMLEPQLLAERILREHATHNDDALVLVFPCSGATERRRDPDRQKA